jgi:hypothetical protein
LIVGSIIAAAMLLGLVGTTWQAVRAETARRAEAEQRAIAESARAAADSESKIAESQRAAADKHRAQAETNFAMARKAVNEYFTKVSESALFDVPGLEPLRGELLESALKFYEKFSVDRTNQRCLPGLSIRPRPRRSHQPAASFCHCCILGCASGGLSWQVNFIGRWC